MALPFARSGISWYFSRDFEHLQVEDTTASIVRAANRRLREADDKEATMRFMIMHKNDSNTEAGNPPPMELVNQMGAFIGEHASAGRFIDGAGLNASKTRTRLVFRNGQCTAKRGPYRG